MLRKEKKDVWKRRLKGTLTLTLCLTMAVSFSVTVRAAEQKQDDEGRGWSAAAAMTDGQEAEPDTDDNRADENAVPDDESAEEKAAEAQDSGTYDPDEDIADDHTAGNGDAAESAPEKDAGSVLTMESPESSRIDAANAGTGSSSDEKTETSKKVKPRFATENGKKVFYDDTGKKITGQIILYDGSRYYTDKNGVIAEMKLLRIDGDIYYAHKQGKFVTNDFMNVTEGNKTNRYYFGSDGKAVHNGKFTVSSGAQKGIYYADKKTCVIAVMKFLNIDGGKYYAHNKGKFVVNDFMNIAEGKTTNRYYFGSDGKAVTNGIFTVSSGVQKGTYYADKNGVVPVMRFLTINGDKYYAHNKGKFVVNDFMNIAEGKTTNRYYFGSDGKAVHNGKFTVSSGAQKGTYYADKKTCVIAVMKFLTIDGGKYYAHRNGRFVTNDFMSIKEGKGTNRYYFGADGKAVGNGFYNISRGRIYVDQYNHVIYNSWFTVAGKKYFAQGDGTLCKNTWKQIGSTWYHFNGNYLVDKTSSTDPLNPMLAKAQRYSSNTRYLILVDRDAHQVGIYQGSIWNWKQVDKFVCSVGKPSTPTVTGQFNIPSKYPRSHPYFDSGDARCWYPTRIYGGYLFHSILYDQTSSPSSIYDVRLGVSVSHGCVRLALDKAKWIYDNVPIGTKVVIY